MVEQKQQQVAAMMDSEQCSDSDLEQLVNDQEMRSTWSRYHLVRDILQGDVPEAIDPALDLRIAAAIANEPALAVTSTEKTNVVSIFAARAKSWAEQAAGFAIAASVTAVMVLGVQKFNAPELPDRGKSAITSLEFLEVDEINLTEQKEFTEIQELLLEETRLYSRYGLQIMSPHVGQVNHSVRIPLVPIKSRFHSILEKPEPEKQQPKKR